MQVWKAFVAYQELLVASEYLGRERAMGVIFYTLGEFPTREEYLYFVESQDTSNASFAAARQYSLIAREIYDAKIKVNEKQKKQCPLFRISITKTRLYNIKPHFHVVKLGFTGVYIIFLISA